MRLLAAEILFSLAVFALQSVPRGDGDWTLAGIAVLGTALPMLLALARRPKPPPRPATTAALVWAGVLFALAQLGFAALRTAKLKLLDIATTTAAAVTALAHGGNPYLLPLDPLAGGMVGAGAALHGYKYLPMTIAAYAPLCLAFGLRGIVLTNVALQAGTAAALGALAKRSGGALAGRAALVFYLSIPFFAFQVLARGANDLAALLPLLLALLVLERRPFAAGALVGLSLAAKLMPGAAALLCLLPARGGRRAYALGVVLGLAPILPFLLWSPHAFVANILLFNTLRPVDDTSWLYGLPPDAILAARALALSALAALYFRVGRAPPRLEARLALMAGAILLVFAVGPDMHHNYYLWFLPLLAPLAALAAVPPPRAGP